MIQFLFMNNLWVKLSWPYKIFWWLCALGDFSN